MQIQHKYILINFIYFLKAKFISDLILVERERIFIAMRLP